MQPVTSLKFFQQPCCQPTSDPLYESFEQSPPKNGVNIPQNARSCVESGSKLAKSHGNLLQRNMVKAVINRSIDGVPLR